MTDSKQTIHPSFVHQTPIYENIVNFERGENLLCDYRLTTDQKESLSEASVLRLYGRRSNESF